MKKSAVILFSLCLLLLLCACSGAEIPAAGGTENASPSVAAPEEEPQTAEYPIREEYRSEDGTLLREAVTDRTDTGDYITVTTYYDPSGEVTGMLEDKLDANKVLLSSRTLSAEGELLSEWTSMVREDGSEEHVNYYENDRVMVRTDRYFDDLANELRSVSTTWFGLERETFASPTAELPDRTYTRWSLAPALEEKSRDFTCYDTPGVRSSETSYSVADDGSITVLFLSFEAETGEASSSDTLSFSADGTLLAKKTVYPDGYTVESTFADGFEIVSYDAEDGERTDYRTDIHTGLLTSVLSCASDGTPFQEKCYDENGFLSEDRFFVEGAPHGKVLYSYDDAGRLVRTETLSAAGAAESITLTFYEESGLVIRTEHYDGENNLLDYRTITYDENGSVSSETVFSPNGRMKEKYEYILDESGVRTGYRHYGEDGKLLDEGSY